LSSKELAAMAIKTGCMLGKLCDVRKRVIALANVLPVGCGKFVAAITRRLFLVNVSTVGKLRVVDTQLRYAPHFRLSLRPDRTVAGDGSCVYSQHNQQTYDE
jgi:hypothetical protein